MSNKINLNLECCPKFDPSLWDEKTFNWESKEFIKDKVFTLFYMPINFGAVITRLTNKVQNAGANIPDWLCLSYHVSKWKMEIFLAVDRNIPESENVNLSGKFMSKVYEGDFKKTKVWCEDFETYVKGSEENVYVVYYVPQMC